MVEIGIIGIGQIVAGTLSLVLFLAQMETWFRDRRNRVALAFALAALGGVMVAGIEFALMKSSTPEEYGALIRWLHLPALLTIISLSVFIHLRYGGTQTWLLKVGIAGRTLAVLINFIVHPNVNYYEITSLGNGTLLGEQFAYPIGIVSPFSILAQGSLAVIVLYFVITAIESIRKSGFRSSVHLIAASTFFMVSALGTVVLFVWGPWKIPLITSIFVTTVLIVAGRDISHAAATAPELEGLVNEANKKLQASDSLIGLSRSVVAVALLTIERGAPEIKVSGAYYEIFGFDPSETVSLDGWIRRVHPDDRGEVRKQLGSLWSSRTKCDLEYRIELPEGGIRWVRSFIQVSMDQADSPMFQMAAIDITEQKETERNLHRISGRLIAVAEDERSNLARDLHDDLSQSLALISIRLELLSRSISDKDEELKGSIQEVVASVQSTAQDVHDLSRRLHPTKLRQLGLDRAIKSLCSEMNEAGKLEIATDFQEPLPVLNDDISLCIYRVVQESLQNIVKHADAERVDVKMKVLGNELCLEVSDDGSGFDHEAERHDGLLGLVSIDERVNYIDGNFELASEIGKGTVIKVRVPLSNPRDGEV